MKLPGATYPPRIRNLFTRETYLGALLVVPLISFIKVSNDTQSDSTVGTDRNRTYWSACYDLCLVDAQSWMGENCARRHGERQNQTSPEGRVLGAADNSVSVDPGNVALCVVKEMSYEWL